MSSLLVPCPPYNSSPNSSSSPTCEKMPTTFLTNTAKRLSFLHYLNRHQQQRGRCEERCTPPRYDELSGMGSISPLSEPDEDDDQASSNQAQQRLLLCAMELQRFDSADQLPSYLEASFVTTEPLTLLWSKYILGSRVSVQNRATGKIEFSCEIEFFVRIPDVNTTRVWPGEESGLKLRLRSGEQKPALLTPIQNGNGNGALDIVQGKTRGHFHIHFPGQQEPLMTVRMKGKGKHEAQVHTSPRIGSTDWHIKMNRRTKTWVVTVQRGEYVDVVARIAHPQGWWKRTASIQVVRGNYMYVVAVALVLFEKEYIMGSAAA